jgi:alpha-beta hydrolase superfamily lysophospholipase
LYKNYINLLINNGYILVGIDLPGHGLSSGKLGDIVDFGQYAHSIEVMIESVKIRFADYNLPFYITGFSAGCAFAIEYLLRNSDKQVISKGLFYAPLLRTTYWHFNGLATYLTPFVKFVPRQSRNISHNPAFINFIRYNDPLQPKFIPLRWVRAMQDWLARLPKYKPINTQLLIIQGTEDKTVDWNYNLPYIAKIFPNHTVRYISGGYHNLLNESVVYNHRVFSYITDYLNK